MFEYCGGTEISADYITGAVIQPQVLSAFSMPALGCAFVLSVASRSRYSELVYWQPRSE